MSYSNNPQRLEEMLPHLASLTLGLTNVRWRVSAGSPNTVAFRIREALWQVSQQPAAYPELSKYARDYSISVQGNEVVARRRTPQISETAAAPPPPPPAIPAAEIDANLFRRQPAEPKPFDLAVRSQNSSAFDGTQTPEQMIALWGSHGSLRRALYFPEADLSQRQLAELWLWCESDQVMMLVHEKSVTLAKREATMLEHAYKPSVAYLAEEFDM